MKLLLITFIIYFTFLDSLNCLTAPPVPDRYCELSSPCLNNATCIDSLYSSYSCICAPEYTGKHCENATRPTSSDPIKVIVPSFCGPNEQCINNGTCIKSADGSSNCVCPPLFTGIHCELYFGGGENTNQADELAIADLSTPATLLNTDYCKTNSSICLNGGTCKTEIYYPYYLCLCTDGVSGDNCEINDFTYDDVKV